MYCCLVSVRESDSTLNEGQNEEKRTEKEKHDLR